MTKFDPNRIICFGEVLWDEFHTGRQPGGAPMNVAFHLQQLGRSVDVISKVGNDEPGMRLLDHMASCGMSTKWISVDEIHPTGRVVVTLDESGSPVYDIVAPVAWDFLQVTNEYLNKVDQHSLLVHGSLACRSEISYLAFKQLKSKAGFRVFDVNLRHPHYSKNVIQGLLFDAHIVKVNEDELEIISNWNGIKGSFKQKANAMRSAYQIDLLILTMGIDGAMAFTDDANYQFPAFPVKVVDTVGSGDAFLGGFLHSFFHGQSIVTCLKWGASLGALVASKAGAMPDYSKQELLKIQGV